MLFGGIEETMVHNVKENVYERKIGPNGDIYVMKLSPSKCPFRDLRTFNAQFEPLIGGSGTFSNSNFLQLQDFKARFICRLNSNLFGRVIIILQMQSGSYQSFFNRSNYLF